MSLFLDADEDAFRTLLGRARAGDGTALGGLFDRFRGYLLAVAAEELDASLVPKVAPSDVVQDAFLEAQQLFDRFQGEQSDEVRAWLRAVLLNKLSTLHRRFVATQKRSVRVEQSHDLAGRTGSADTPSTEAMRTEERAALLATLERLPPVARQIVLWRTWDDLSFAEIGERLGKTADAARMAFARALEKLQDEMGPAP